MSMTDFAGPMIFIDESDYVRPDGSTTPSTRRLLQPMYDFDWSPWTEVTWVLSIRDTTGSPSSWSLTPKLEYAADSVRASGTVYGQYRDRRWYDADPVTDVAGGTFFGAITATGTLQRTVRNFPRQMRVNLSDFTMTGGTDPGLRMTLIAYPKKG